MPRKALGELHRKGKTIVCVLATPLKREEQLQSLPVIVKSHSTVPTQWLYAELCLWLDSARLV